MAMDDKKRHGAARRRPRTPALAACLVLGLFVPSVRAHEDGAPFSGAILDPFRVHHAHIENEQRLNLSILDGFRGDSGERSAFRSSLELATDWSQEFRFGSEILIPFENTGVDEDDFGVGDIEFWPLKYAFINEPETVFTGVLGLELPTGRESTGLGEGKTGVGALFFLDHAYRNWYWGLNTEFTRVVAGERGTEMEIASAIAYSFIAGTGDGMAASRPEQDWVPSLSFEIIAKSVLDGSEEGSNVVTAIPGVSLWSTDSGWTLRLGVELPLSSEREADATVLLQIGNHATWSRLFR
jgi:hypothetical protein